MKIAVRTWDWSYRTANLCTEKPGLSWSSFIILGRTQPKERVVGRGFELRLTQKSKCRVMVITVRLPLRK